MAASPGRLREAHVHLHALGAELSCVQLADCAGAAECLERLAAAARDAPRDAWVQAVGARIEAWTDRAWPTPAQVDEAVGGRPCIVRSFDHHALLAGAAALQMAGVDRHTADPARGLIVRSATTGEPTGLLLEQACELVEGALPAPSDERRRENLRAAIDALAAHGFDEAHDMLSEPWLGPMLASMDDESPLPLEIWLYTPYERLEAALEASEEFSRERVHLAGAKLFLDGTLNSRTALMLDPYADPLPAAPRGKAMFERSELVDILRWCDELGAPCAMHAIGDGAVRMALDAIEAAEPEMLGMRIEHCQFVDAADVPRFAQLGVIASVQPCHLLTDIEALRRLTPHRLDRAFPLRDLIDAAVSAGWDAEDLVWLGSDAPIVPPNPADNVQAAVERRRAGMTAAEAIGPGQAITREEALACMRARGDDETM